MEFIIHKLFDDFYDELKKYLKDESLDSIMEKINEIDIQKLLEIIREKEKSMLIKTDDYDNKNNTHLIFIVCLIFCICLETTNNKNIQDYKSKLIKFFSSIKIISYISSDIPYFGSGLGSSGSFNTVLANFFLFLLLRAEGIKDFLAKEKTFCLVNPPSDLFISLDPNSFSSSDEIIKQITLIVTYLGEKIFHLKPSGIDNVTSLLGGLINFSNFQTKKFHKKDKFLFNKLKESFCFYLIDTKVKRNTSTFINQVSNFKANFSVIFENSINSISNLVEKLNDIFLLEECNQANSCFEEKNKINFLKILELNQHLLSIIQVSSKEIDSIVHSMQEIEVVAKITGAGGGGFVLAVVEKEKLKRFYEVCRNKELTFFDCNLSEEGLKTEIHIE